VARLSTVVILANPYEGELCRRALAETGLEIVLSEGADGVEEELAKDRPLALVLAFGVLHADSRALLEGARRRHPTLPIFLLCDRGGEVADVVSARTMGASGLFTRPIDAAALADSIERLAVAAELSGDVAPRLTMPVRPAVIPTPGGFAEVQISPQRTEVLPEASELSAPPPQATLPDRAPAPAVLAIGGPALSGVARGAPALMRADDAIADAAGLGLSHLAVSADFLPPRREGGESRALPAPVPAFDERSTFARRLDHELSAAERRLFPEEAPPSARFRDDFGDYDDALGDIDLDSLGLDTIPGLSFDGLEPPRRLPRDPPSGAPPILDPPTPLATPLATPLPTSSPAALAQPPQPAVSLPPAPVPVDDAGSLASRDVATLLASLHASGWTGRAWFSRADGEKAVFFDSGTPVFATSSFPADRLGDLLYREGKLGREQYARTREISTPAGRRTAMKLVELGLLKEPEVFSALRRHVEEIVFSLFAWAEGEYRLSTEQPVADDRVRLSQHPWALFAEGVRRKYGLERLVDLIGPPEIVVVPNELFRRALDHAGLEANERAAAELFDGERSIADVRLAVGALPNRSLSEAALYGLVWTLQAVGAVRLGEGGADQAVRLRAVATTTTADGAARAAEVDRRVRERDATERPADRIIDRERLLAKRAQIGDGDYFAILGVDRQATTHEIHRAFERLTEDFRPERFADPVRSELGDALLEIKEVLDEAHRVLADDQLRRAYREHLIE
jgi:DNA-binding response OmpR family regulator